MIQQPWKLETYGERDEGLQNLSKKFRMCRDLKSSEKVQDWLSSAYSNLAMVDYPYPAGNFKADEKDNSRKESSR